jgi:hypothetical protein
VIGDDARAAAGVKCVSGRQRNLEEVVSTRDSADTPVGEFPSAPAGEAPLSWPTAWAAIGGGFFLIWPYLRGVLAGLGIAAAGDGAIRQPVILSLGAGVGLLLLSLPGWWTFLRGSRSGQTGVVLLALGFGMWFLDIADNVGGGALLPFGVPAGVYAAAVGIGSLLVPLGLARTSSLSRDGLLLVGIGGPLAMALLAAPWPLGLGPIVPAVVLLYAIGWIRLGLAFRRTQQHAPLEQPAQRREREVQT